MLNGGCGLDDNLKFLVPRQIIINAHSDSLQLDEHERPEKLIHQSDICSGLTIVGGADVVVEKAFIGGANLAVGEVICHG